MPKKAVTKSRGFSLIEIIIFMGVMGIFIVLLFSALNSFFKSRSTSRKLNALQETTTYVLNELTQEIHWSDQAVIGDNGLLDSLTLEQTQIDEYDEPITVYRVFEVENGQFFKDNAPLSGPDIKVVGFEIQNLASETPDASDETPVQCLSISLELEYLGSEPKISSAHQTTISLRKMKFQSI
ncbi:MAG TPA: type II secretion system protein [Candidatus Bathyarchaeia archaeon]|nr:type II secretion system protein [Candidatus Bathyarchaeia archaeon]